MTTRTFARNYAGSLEGEGECHVGTCKDAKNAHYQVVTLSDWPPNSVVTCSGVWDNRAVSTSITVDGSGGYRDRPIWRGYNNVLMTLQDQGTWFTCT